VALIIVDYGVGNLGSIPNMLKRLGERAVISSDPSEVKAADRLILPGVGAFDAGARSLRTQGLIEPLRQRVLEDGVPTLGLCLGMELLFESSEEGQESGLGWIGGRIERFSFSDGARRPIPHMGWNTVKVERQHPLVADLGDEPRFYFAHSYHARCADPTDVVATATYGYEFPAVVARANVVGAQFHPEKSHRFGLKLLGNFLALRP
jgi:imidazole glycerol-phosphate synthase subunit HisH